MNPMQQIATHCDLDAIVLRFWGKCTPETPGCCRLWTAAVDKDGYGKFQVTNPKGRPKQWHLRAHRFSYWIAWRVSPVVVRHSCDTPACVNPEHLIGGSQKDNIRDMDDRGRRAKGYSKPGCSGDQHWSRRNPSQTVNGERHGMSKLTDRDVATIKEMLASGESQMIIAAYFGVHKGTISKISTGKSWKHVTV